MHDFILKEIINTEIKPELEDIGFDKTYSDKASEKFEYKKIKIYDLTPVQANILKQTALSCGTDCATHRDVITGNIELSDVIIGGSVLQLRKIAQKLNYQPFSLKDLSYKIETFLNKQPKYKPEIMGILNITDNSFSDGGLYNDFEKAKEHLNQLIEDGADIVDIGAESTKPYSKPVSAAEQLEKIIPILKYIKENNIKIPISIDTRNAEVAATCIKYGVHFINDVSGFEYDNKMVDIVAQGNVKVIIQHSKGTPENMQNSPHYENLIDEIYLNLNKKVDYAISKGVKQENIIIDPGIGFGKTRENNFEIIRRIEEFKGLSCPILLGISRKSLLNMSEQQNEIKDIFTVALNTLALERKVDIIRVHNVKLHKMLFNLLQV